MHLTRHPKLQVWDVQGGGLDHNIGSVGSQGAEDTASYIAGSQIWKPLASSSAGSICARAGIRKASKLETMLTMRSQLKATALKLTLCLEFKLRYQRCDHKGPSVTL